MRKGCLGFLLILPPLHPQIYDLSVDALSPTFYFLLPSSKIRDVTFLFNEEGKNIIVIMSSAGYIYTQLMEEASSAQHGPFYVTNVLEVSHEDLKVMVVFSCIAVMVYFLPLLLKGTGGSIFFFPWFHSVVCNLQPHRLNEWLGAGAWAGSCSYSPAC